MKNFLLFGSVLGLVVLVLPTLLGGTDVEVFKMLCFIGGFGLIVSSLMGTIKQQS